MTEKDKLHNAIGNQIGECKKRLFDRIDKGTNPEDSIATFIAELRLGMEIVLREQKLKSEEPATIN